MMKVRTLRQHTSRHGRHREGDVYEESNQEAETKIKAGIVEEVKAKKAAPENKSKSSD